MSTQIKKSTRFEVFKRDGFTCQYCGQKAPDVLLHVDHIKAQTNGGGHDLLNLITACADCNLGKGARELDDDSVVKKQQRQLEELGERRSQLEMMLQWREGLSSIDADKVDAVVAEIQKYFNFNPTDYAFKCIRQWLRRFPLDELLDAAEVSCEQYLIFRDDGPDADSVNKAFNYIPRICNAKRTVEKKPHMRDLFYARGILRNRLNYVNEPLSLKLMEKAHGLGYSTEDLRQLALDVRHWTEFRQTIESWIEEAPA